MYSKRTGISLQTQIKYSSKGAELGFQFQALSNHISDYFPVSNTPIKLTEFQLIKLLNSKIRES